MPLNLLRKFFYIICHSNYYHKAPTKPRKIYTQAVNIISETEVILMKTLLALALLLVLLAPLASGANDITIKGNADVNVAPDTYPDVVVNEAEPDVVVIPEDKPDVVVVPEDEPDVIVQEERDVEVVPIPVERDEVNIPGFEAAFAAVGILAALRALRRKD